MTNEYKILNIMNEAEDALQPYFKKNKDIAYKL